jgi:hypothetical protein
MSRWPVVSVWQRGGDYSAKALIFIVQGWDWLEVLEVRLLFALERELWELWSLCDHAVAQARRHYSLTAESWIQPWVISFEICVEGMSSRQVFLHFLSFSVSVIPPSRHVTSLVFRFGVSPCNWYVGCFCTCNILQGCVKLIYITSIYGGEVLGHCSLWDVCKIRNKLCRVQWSFLIVK